MVTNKASVLNAAELGRPEGAVQGAENGHGGLGSSGTPAWWGTGGKESRERPQLVEDGVDGGAPGHREPKASGERAMHCLCVGFAGPGGPQRGCPCEHLPPSESEEGGAERLSGNTRAICAII